MVRVEYPGSMWKQSRSCCEQVRWKEKLLVARKEFHVPKRRLVTPPGPTFRRPGV